MMNKMRCLLAVGIAAALGLSTSVQARGHGYGGGHATNTETPRFERRVDRRQERQWDRIRNGIESGDLSRREARRLIGNQKKLSRMERRFERDGYYSPREKRRMERALDRASKRIRRLKDRDSPGHWHRHGWRHWQSSRYEDTYAASTSSSASKTAPTDGFSISWNRWLTD